MPVLLNLRQGSDHLHLHPQIHLFRSSPEGSLNPPHSRQDWLFSYFQRHMVPIVHNVVLVPPDSYKLLPQLLKRIDGSVCGLQQDQREAALASPSVSAPQVGSIHWFVRTATLPDTLRTGNLYSLQ